MFDVLIVGGGVAGVSCALILGSAHKKIYAQNKKIGIIAHQKASHLQDALFNNVYGVKPGTLGSDLLQSSLRDLSETYPHVEQIADEKVMKIEKVSDHFMVYTNKNSYASKIIVIATNYGNAFHIEGLMQYVIPHKKSIAEKKRIQLVNEDHLVTQGIYAAGSIAGHRSQLSIAAGSGAAVATDILTLWNGGADAQSHDKK